jgi:serine/threonine-protein kinase RsbW
VFPHSTGYGKYFNPLDREKADVGAAIEDRPVGGLGIYLVKSMVDDIRYCRVGESNVLERALTF